MAHILVATDGSAGASRAVDMATELAKALTCELLIVAVADRLLGEGGRPAPPGGGGGSTAAAAWRCERGRTAGSAIDSDAEGCRSARSRAGRMPDRSSNCLG